MPRLPSARDVSNVSPRVANDPGVRAPAQAFESPLGTVAKELAPAADVFAQVALKQENRRDTVDRSSRINQYAKDADLELRRLNTEADLSDEKVLSSYGSFLSERRQKLIEEHGGSKDSIATLTMRLGDVESQSIGQASSISTNIGREKVKKTFGNALAPLVEGASQTPSLENINKLFLGLETQIGDIKAAFDPTEEDTFRSAGREQIVRSAVNSLITRGRVETAESLLRDGGLTKFLPQDAHDEVQRKIETIRFAREETTRKIAQAEAVLGRPLKDTERLSLIGLGKENKLIEVGDPSSPTGTRFVYESQAVGRPGVSKNSSMGTVPPGWQLIRDPSNPSSLRMAPIPDSPADIEMRAAKQKQAERQEMAMGQSKAVVRSVDRAVQMMGNLDFPETLPGSNLARAGMRLIGGSVFDVDNELETIKSNIAVDGIQQMRAASPTGGALGSTSDKDIALLQQLKGSLNVRQKPEILRQNLSDIREIYLNAWFGSPEEIQAAVEDGKITPQHAMQLQKERETIGFDAIGKVIDQAEKTKGKKSSTKDVSTMTLQDITAITDEQIDQMDSKTQKALEKRLTELGR